MKTLRIFKEIYEFIWNFAYKFNFSIYANESWRVLSLLKLIDMMDSTKPLCRKSDQNSEPLGYIPFYFDLPLCGSENLILIRVVVDTTFLAFWTQFFFNCSCSVRDCMGLFIDSKSKLWPRKQPKIAQEFLYSHLIFTRSI